MQLDDFVLQAIKLSQFDIKYNPQSAIKAQMLADFIAQSTVEEVEQNSYIGQTIKVNGSLNKKARGAESSITRK